MSYYQGQASNYLTLLDELRDFATDEATTWIASTSYSVGDFIIPTTPNGYRYRCTDAGTSGSAEPGSWTTTIGDTELDDVSSGDAVTWTCVNVLLGADKWTIVEETYSSGGSTDGLLWLEGVGVNSNEVYVGMNTVSDVGKFNWELNGAIDWNSGVSFYAQSGCLTSGFVPYLLLDDDPMTFTFLADAKRIVIHARPGGTVTESGYLGLINLYFPYNAYPYPILIGGCSDTDQAFSATGSSHSWYLQPLDSAIAYLRDNGGNWVNFYNATTLLDNKLYMYPNRWLGTTQRLATTIDGDYLVMPISLLHYTSASTTMSLIGELNGVLWVVGYLLSVGDTITVGGDTYYVINDTYRTDDRAFSCIKLE